MPRLQRVPVSSVRHDCAWFTDTAGAIGDSGSGCVVAPLTATTGLIGGGPLTAGQCTSGTVTVTGASNSMAVIATPVTYPGDGMAWRAYSSGAGLVTVKLCAEVAGTPTASIYNVRVIQ